MPVDGSLIFNTKIDSDGFSKGTKEITSKVIELKNKISATEDEITSLRQELEKMADTPIKSNATEKLEKDIEKAKTQLRALYEEADRIGNSKQSDLTSMGFGTEYLDDMLAQDKNWQKVQTQIDETEAKLQSYERELNQVKSAESQVTGKDTAEYKKKAQKLKELSGQLNVYKAKLKETASKEKSTANATKKTTSIFDRFKKSLSKASKALSSVFKKSHSTQMNGLSKAFNTFKQALLGIIIYQGIQKTFELLKEGMQNLAQASPEANNSLSMLMSSLTQLKNSFATAFAPILNIVAPILSTFIDMLSSAADKIAQFMTALTGKNTYTKAVKVQQDYAESVADSTSATEDNTKATEENQKNLAGYDELNVMQQDSSTTSSAEESGSISPQDMFTTATVSDGISGFAEQLKTMLKEHDFSGIGELLGEKINSGIQKAKEFITGHNWSGIAEAFASGLNGLVNGINWGELASTLSLGLTTLLDTVKTFFDTFDFGNLGTKLAEFINNIDILGILGSIGGTLSSLISGILDFLIGFVEETDWGELASNIFDGIVNFIKNIDWGGLISKIFQLIGGVIGGSLKFVMSLQAKLWDLIKQAWNSMKDYFGEKISEAGGNVFQGLLNGIVEGVKNIGTWIYENVLLPFVDGFKNAFDIDSLTPEMSNVVTSIEEFFSNVWTKITEVFGSIKEWFSDKFSEAWIAIKAVFSIKNVSEFFGQIWTGIKNAFSNVSNWFKEIFSNAWQKVKDVFSKGGKIFEGIKDGILSSLKNVINNLISGINEVIEKPFNGLNKALSVVRNIEILGAKPFNWIDEISIPQIPKLATGTVVPANYGEFLAVLGDNKREAEVVSPISAMKQSFLEALAEGGFNGGNGQPDEINIYIDGDKIFKVIVDRDNSHKKTHGRSAFT